MQLKHLLQSKAACSEGVCKDSADSDCQCLAREADLLHHIPVQGSSPWHLSLCLQRRKNPAQLCARQRLWSPAEDGAVALFFLYFKAVQVIQVFCLIWQNTRFFIGYTCNMKVMNPQALEVFMYCCLHRLIAELPQSLLTPEKILSCNNKVRVGNKWKIWVYIHSDWNQIALQDGMYCTEYHRSLNVFI